MSPPSPLTRHCQEPTHNLDLTAWLGRDDLFVIAATRVLPSHVVAEQEVGGCRQRVDRHHVEQETMVIHRHTNYASTETGRVAHNTNTTMAAKAPTAAESFAPVSLYTDTETRCEGPTDECERVDLSVPRTPAGDWLELASCVPARGMGAGLVRTWAVAESWLCVSA